MKYFIRIWQGVEHKVLGSKDDTKICDGCKIEFNQKNFQIATYFKKFHVPFSTIKFKNYWS